MSNLVIFLGPPGAGKGTQAVTIAKEKNLAHISTGDMLREHVSNETELGKIAKTLLDEGKLVPDSLVIEMLQERLLSVDCANGAILDGFPRTIAQAESLENISAEFKISKVISERNCPNFFQDVWIFPFLIFISRMSSLH